MEDVFCMSLRFSLGAVCWDVWQCQDNTQIRRAKSDQKSNRVGSKESGILQNVTSLGISVSVLALVFEKTFGSKVFGEKVTRASLRS